MMPVVGGVAVNPNLEAGLMNSKYPCVGKQEIPDLVIHPR